MKYYEVTLRRDFVNDCEAKGNIKLCDMDSYKSQKTVCDYLRKAVKKESLKEPVGILKHKFLVPGGGYTTLWDWDSFFMACSVDDELLEYAKGSVSNLIENIGSDGKPAKNVSPNGEADPRCTPLPLQAQYAYVIAKRLNDFSWMEKYWDSFERMIDWFDTHCTNNGYYVYPNLYGNGIDNNPAVYGRGTMGTSPCDLISFMYREFCAMAKLAGMFCPQREEYYKEKARRLKDFFRDKYFDQMDKCFYSIDCNINPGEITMQKINWVTYLKFRSWANIFPLWAGLATKEQAEYMKKYIMSEEHFLSVCGIRSHAKSDPVYNNAAMGNPSNWQGPVWGLSTFLTAYALARYGYRGEAIDVSMRLIKTYANDIEQNGCIHEYYHGDTGQPVIRPYFTSWNVMALRVVDDIKNGRDFTTFDLLD